MKTLIISSSLNPESKSYTLCRAIEKELQQKDGTEVSFLNLRDVELNLHHQEQTSSMHMAADMVEKADNYIFGMAVYNYSINDSLKAFLDNCFPGEENKLFGIACSAGGDKSYLATTHLTQIAMNEWRMIPLPRVLYVSGRDYEKDGSFSDDIQVRIEQFATDFYTVGTKLTA